MDERIENYDGNGYDVGCSCCDAFLGWVPTLDEYPDKLVFCGSCLSNPRWALSGCTEESLLRDGSNAAMLELGHRQEAARMERAIFENRLHSNNIYEWADIPF